MAKRVIVATPHLLIRLDALTKRTHVKNQIGNQEDNKVIKGVHFPLVLLLTKSSCIILSIVVVVGKVLKTNLPSL